MANEKIVNRENLKAFREKYDERLENGQVIPSKSLVAKELETISPESGDTQETPFALQGTGTANGTSSVDTGTVGKHIQKQGSVYCVNQGFNLTGDNRTDYCSYTSNTTTNSFKLKITESQPLNRIRLAYYRGVIGRKYLIICNAKYLNKDENSNLTINCDTGNSYNVVTSSLTTSYARYYKVWTCDYNGVFTIGIRGTRAVNDEVELQDFNIIDLTQWFNGNVPQDLLDHPEHWSWYQTYGDYIPYNTGTLVSGNGRYLVCGGRNVWDEQWELGNWSITNGQAGSLTDRVRCKNFIQVIPSTNYYFKSTGAMRILCYDKDKNYIGQIDGDNTWYNVYKETPSNCYYIKFNLLNTYGTTYKNDITISLYYAGEDYSQYYQYEQPKVYDTGTETLLSTGVKLSVSGEREDIYDYKEPNGLITRRVGSVKLKDLSWTYISTESGHEYFQTNSALTNVKAPADNTTQANIFSNIYISTTHTSGVYNHNTPKGIAVRSNGKLTVYDSSYTDATTFKNHFTDNDYLYYELATTTTEQGTPFSENIEINDFGTMGWYATYTDANTNALVSVPQGCKIFYPAWYVGFVDTLGQRADIDWNANNVVSQTQLTQALSTFLSSISGYDATKTQTLKNVGGVFQWVDDE